MSHNAVCNTTVSTKKIRPTLVKQVRKLCVALHACKGNSPVSVKEECVLVQAIKCGYGCVYVSVTFNQISSRRLLVCICVIEVLKRGALRDVAMCVYVWVSVIVILQ